MADQPTTPSGSRWEPDPDESPTADTPAHESPEDRTADAPDPVQPPAAAPSYSVATDAAPPVLPLDDPAAEERRAQLRTRAILAGAATALTLGGGLTGFVIGHSTAGNGANDFRPANFSGQVPGNGQLGEGQAPPSFGDRDNDGDGDGRGFGQQPPGADGSSGSSSNSSGSGTTGNPT